MNVWTAEMTHAQGCAPCYEAAGKAIDLAKCTGSSGATYNDNGFHTAKVTRVKS